MNVLRKWKHWNIKTESKKSIPLLYCEIFFILSAYPFVNYVMFLGISRVEPKLLQYISDTLTYHSLSVHPKYHSLLASHHVEPHPTDQRCLDSHKSLNLNIAYYFINNLASPHINTWHHIGVPITQIIDHFGLNCNYRGSVEHTWNKLLAV